MANKKDLTIEELKQACDEARDNFKTLNDQLNKAIKEEEDRKKAELALEKETRRKEVDEARDKYFTLVKEYIKDYGSYTTVSRTQDYPFDLWF